jgi:hypothetical protein
MKEEAAPRSSMMRMSSPRMDGARFKPSVFDAGIEQLQGIRKEQKLTFKVRLRVIVTS